MKNIALIASVGMVMAGVYYLNKNGSPGQLIDLTGGQGLDTSTGELGVSDIFNNVTEPITSYLDGATMGLFNLSGMKSAKREMIGLPNVQAMLAVIRKGEGTSDQDGYRRIFGGQLFTGFEDHPRIVVTAGRYKSSAAGAYQFLSSTWDETARAMGITDFSPTNQDYAALGRIAARGALADVLAGRFNAAIAKIGKEWASIPGSPYGQPTQTLAGAQQVYLQNGGTLA